MVIEFKQAIGGCAQFKQEKNNRVGWQGKSCSCCSGAYNTEIWFKLCLNWAKHGSIHGNTWQYMAIQKVTLTRKGSSKLEYAQGTNVTHSI
jgi:hypothetical protein